jgi:hypothetical protein
MNGTEEENNNGLSTPTPLNVTPTPLQNPVFNSGPTPVTTSTTLQPTPTQVYSSPAAETLSPASTTQLDPEPTVYEPTQSFEPTPVQPLYQSEPMQDPYPTPEPPKKSKTPLVVIIILSLLLLAAASYIAYTQFFQAKTNEASNTQTNTATTEEPAVTSPDAVAVVEKLRTAINDKFIAKFPTMKIENSFNLPIYKAEGIDYAVGSNEALLGHGLNVSLNSNASTPDTTGSKEVTDFASSVLSDEKFQKTSEFWMESYQSDTVVCNVLLSSTPVSISCANKSTYTELIANLKPFATSYLASETGKQNKDTLLLGDAKVTYKSPGYSSAIVTIANIKSPVGGAAGFFYSKDNVWTYWRSSQAGLLCTDYNTRDLQKGFEGDSCIEGNAGKAATVKVTL